MNDFRGVITFLEYLIGTIQYNNTYDNYASFYIMHKGFGCMRRFCRKHSRENIVNKLSDIQKCIICDDIMSFRCFYQEEWDYIYNEALQCDSLGERNLILRHLLFNTKIQIEAREAPIRISKLCSIISKDIPWALII